MERNSHLTPDDIALVGETFLPCFERKKFSLVESFCINAGKFLEASDRPRQLKEEAQIVYSALEQPLRDAQLLRTQLDADRLVKVQSISPNRENDQVSGRLPIIMGRIRVLLNEPLPFYLRPFKKFALDKHPELVQIDKEIDAAKTHHEKVIREQVALSQVRQEEFRQKQIPATQDITDQEQSFYRFMEGVVSEDVNASRTYLYLLPTRTEPLLNQLVRTQFTRQPEQFANFIGRELAEANNQRKALTNRFPNLLEGNMNEQELNSLPEKIRNNWRNYLRDYLTSLLEI